MPKTLKEKREEWERQFQKRKVSPEETLRWVEEIIRNGDLEDWDWIKSWNENRDPRLGFIVWSDNTIRQAIQCKRWNWAIECIEKRGMRSDFYWLILEAWKENPQEVEILKDCIESLPESKWKNKDGLGNKEFERVWNRAFKKRDWETIQIISDAAFMKLRRGEGKKDYYQWMENRWKGWEMMIDLGVVRETLKVRDWLLEVEAFQGTRSDLAIREKVIGGWSKILRGRHWGLMKQWLEEESGNTKSSVREKEDWKLDWIGTNQWLRAIMEVEKENEEVLKWMVESSGISMKISVSSWSRAIKMSEESALRVLRLWSEWGVRDPWRADWMSSEIETKIKKDLKDNVFSIWNEIGQRDRAQKEKIEYENCLSNEKSMEKCEVEMKSQEGSVRGRRI